MTFSTEKVRLQNISKSVLLLLCGSWNAFEGLLYVFYFGVLKYIFTSLLLFGLDVVFVGLLLRASFSRGWVGLEFVVIFSGAMLAVNAFVSLGDAIRVVLHSDSIGEVVQDATFAYLFIHVVSIGALVYLWWWRTRAVASLNR